MRDLKVYFFTILLLIFILNSASFVALGDPVVNEITVDPENPDSISTFTVTANISGENISKVNLTITGCSDTQCFADLMQKVEMDLTPHGKFQAEISFNDPKEKANNIKYEFEITIKDGTEYRLNDPSWKTYINLDTNENNGVTDNQTDDNNTPGFELSFVLIALFISFLIYYKKR